MSLAATVAAQIAKRGQSVTLKRRVGTTTNFTTAIVPGKVHHYRPDELVGGIIQGDRRVTIAPSSLAGTDWEGLVPRKGDFVEIDGAQAAVQGCEPRSVGNEVARYEIWVRG
jgi:hypothetical protein